MPPASVSSDPRPLSPRVLIVVAAEGLHGQRALADRLQERPQTLGPASAVMDQSSWGAFRRPCAATALAIYDGNLNE